MSRDRRSASQPVIQSSFLYMIIYVAPENGLAIQSCIHLQLQHWKLKCFAAEWSLAATNPGEGAGREVLQRRLIVAALEGQEIKYREPK